MPFHRAFDELYHLGIKEAAKRAGAYAERVDEQDYGGIVLDRIINQIAKADVIVAVTTGRNPNVFYEIGYAHALGKTPLLLTMQPDEIPFDLRHWAHTVYDDNVQALCIQLEKKIRWAIQQGQPQISYPSFPVRIRVCHNSTRNMPLAGVPRFENLYSMSVCTFKLVIDNWNPIASPALTYWYALAPDHAPIHLADERVVSPGYYQNIIPPLGVHKIVGGAARLRRFRLPISVGPLPPYGTEVRLFSFACEDPGFLPPSIVLRVPCESSVFDLEVSLDQSGVQTEATPIGAIDLDASTEPQ